MFSVSPWSIAYLDAAKTLGAGQGATVVYHGDQLSVDQAAFVNSAFGHGGEFDDTQLGSNTHSGAAIVPVALALAENRGLTGQQSLEAVIVGVEIMTRIGAGASAASRRARLPCAADRGALRRGRRSLPPAWHRRSHLRQCHGHCGQSFQRHARIHAIRRHHEAHSLRDPGDVGPAFRVMAMHGITGPRTIIDGDRGILHCFAGEYDLAKVTNGLGDRLSDDRDGV